MIYLEAGTYVRVQQLNGKAHPLPLESGFTEAKAYRALGIYSPSETSECYFVLANDRDETWFISNRHLRIVGVFPDRLMLRFPLADKSASQSSALTVKSCAQTAELQA